MKLAELDKLQEAGLITLEQKEKIADHLNLREHEGSRFLAIVSFIGAALVACGIILLIASNWEAIPRGVKIGTGLAMLLAVHAGGWYLRDHSGKYPKTGEALHAIGAALFLGNIALLGQVYHLSSRMPNAFLLWWLGIAALPWILRSKALHILALAAFCVWFGSELNEASSRLYVGDQTQMLLYALLGLCFLGFGYWLRGSNSAEFAGSLEKLGLAGLLVCLYPLTWRGFLDTRVSGEHAPARWLFPAMVGIALLALATGTMRRRDLTLQWRWTWGSCLAGLAGLMSAAYYLPHSSNYWIQNEEYYFHWVSLVTLFAFTLVQIQVGVQSRSQFMVNLGIAFVALLIITAYVSLFGSMAQTGVVFLIGGVFLIGLGIYLEKQRRALVKKMLVNPQLR